MRTEITSAVMTIPGSSRRNERRGRARCGLPGRGAAASAGGGGSTGGGGSAGAGRSVGVGGTSTGVVSVRAGGRQRPRTVLGGHRESPSVPERQRRITHGDATPRSRAYGAGEPALRHGGSHPVESRRRAEAGHVARWPDDAEGAPDDLVLGHRAATRVAGVGPRVGRGLAVVAHHPEPPGRDGDVERRLGGDVAGKEVLGLVEGRPVDRHPALWRRSRPPGHPGRRSPA